MQPNLSRQAKPTVIWPMKCEICRKTKHTREQWYRELNAAKTPAQLVQKAATGETRQEPDQNAAQQEILLEIDKTGL